jgi:hypothetical protein
LEKWGYRVVCKISSFKVRLISRFKACELLPSYPNTVDHIKCLGATSHNPNNKVTGSEKKPIFMDYSTFSNAVGDTIIRKLISMKDILCEDDNVDCKLYSRCFYSIPCLPSLSEPVWGPKLPEEMKE